MPAYFTHYWRPKKIASSAPPRRCTQAFSSQFIERGISAGDRVYLVNYAAKRPFLVGAFTVAANPVELPEGVERIEAVPGTGAVIDFHRPIPLDVARSIVRADTGKGLIFVSEDTLSSQTLRGVQRITPESAKLLEVLLDDSAALDEASATEAELTIEESAIFPDEIEPDAAFIEGTTLQVLVNRYERDPAARAACLAEYGAVCAVCEFNFADWYGPLGDGFIHVHHVTPISEVGGAYRIDPIRDLVPVCPNCHAMLHRTYPPLPVEHLATIFHRHLERNSNAEADGP